MNEQTKKEALDKHRSLSSIVEQLEQCEFECEGCTLKNNLAFIALKEMANIEKESTINIFAYYAMQNIKDGVNNFFNIPDEDEQ